SEVLRLQAAAHGTVVGLHPAWGGPGRAQDFDVRINRYNFL
nr:hypothetical protein [Tanacetum cinerariifolium]